MIGQNNPFSHQCLPLFVDHTLINTGLTLFLSPLFTNTIKSLWDIETLRVSNGQGKILQDPKTFHQFPLF